MTELLCPAGNMEKMKAALRYGADAVYLAGNAFGMRAAADNFTVDELYEAVRYAHSYGKKVYLTVNTIPHWEEFDALEEYLDSISSSGIDAAIVADPGVFSLVKQHIPTTQIHMSTQAGCVSHADCNFWHKMGASRVVLARELSFKDIAEIRRRISPELEIETFVHGSMCVSFSSRCMLSENLIGRDANRGRCAQPCRWNYNLFEIAEEKRPDMRFPVEETPLGTFIMSSKDMCMIEHIPELVESGIASFKIEGRMKSAYYAAVTANAYRMAIDAYKKDPAGYTYDPLWLAELESVSHREYCTGYFFESPHETANLTANTGYIREKAYLAVAEGYDESTGRALFRQRNKVIAGDVAELITPGAPGMRYAITDMRDTEGNSLESAPHPNMLFTVQSERPVKVGDILRGGN